MSLRSAVIRARRGLPLVLLVPMWAAAACGGDTKSPQAGQKVVSNARTSSSQAATPSWDPCALLTMDEVAAAAGWKPQTTEPYTRGEYGSCTFVGRKDPMVLPPEKVEVGVGKCPTNMPCSELPDFHSSQEMVQFRKKGYAEQAFGDMHPEIVPLEGFGVPAIDHELATMRSIEMQIGHNRLAYVTTWGASGPARDLAKKALARLR